VSGFLNTSRMLRYGSQLIAGLAIGFALGGAVHEAHAEDATSLLANPRRLDEVQRGCKVNAPCATEALCREAAQAIRLRFRGQGVPYTPRKVEPFASHPGPKPAQGAAPHRKPEASHERPNAGAPRVS
jgi:hypothetical protein